MFRKEVDFAKKKHSVKTTESNTHELCFKKLKGMRNYSFNGKHFRN
jgi:hypothetical protein